MLAVWMPGQFTSMTREKRIGVHMEKITKQAELRYAEQPFVLIAQTLKI